MLASERLDREEAERYCADVLARYDENREVEEHEVECHCVGWKARAAAAHEAMVARWKAAEREAEKAHPEYGKPDPECEDCEGSGRVRTTTNPEGYWDWWTISGRWAGVLDPDYDPASDPRNFGTCTLCGGTGQRPGCNGCQGTGVERHFHNAPHDRDVLPLAEVAESVDVPEHFYAVVTPDGEWHQQGRMGWFGMSSDDMDDATWRGYVRTLLDAHPEATAIVVDCHV